MKNVFLFTFSKLTKFIREICFSGGKAHVKMRAHILFQRGMALIGEGKRERVTVVLHFVRDIAVWGSDML